MLSLQEISDRLEIEDLLSRHSYAIDEQGCDALDQIFAADAVIDYTETAGAKGSVKQIKGWLPKVLARFPSYQHMIATRRLELDGDTARYRSVLCNPMRYQANDGTEQVFFIGLWYRDRLVRTANGWRMAERYEEFSYAHDVPDMSPVPPLE